MTHTQVTHSCTQVTHGSLTGRTHCEHTGCQHESVRQYCGQILQRVHGNVRLPAEERHVQLLGEDALSVCVRTKEAEQK